MSQYEELYRRSTENFAIIGEVREEDESPYGSFDDHEIIEDICEGRIMWFQVRVRVVRRDIDGDDGLTLASEYLGGCAYYSASEFFARDSGFYDMVREACDQARRLINGTTLRSPR